MNVDIKTRQEEVQKELNNILNSPSFKKSPRSSELLSYLVNHKLNKGGSPLKGEIISQDVFGRISQNDADDTIVRVSASRLRKMLKAYYHETGKSSNWRIALPTGSYEINFKAATDIDAPIKRASGEVLRRYFKPLFICAAVLIATVFSFQFYETRTPHKLTNTITPYPNIHVFRFENLTQEEK